MKVSDVQLNGSNVLKLLGLAAMMFLLSSCLGMPCCNAGSCCDGGSGEGKTTVRRCPQPQDQPQYQLQEHRVRQNSGIVSRSLILILVEMTGMSVLGLEYQANLNRKDCGICQAVNLIVISGVKTTSMALPQAVVNV